MLVHEMFTFFFKVFLCFCSTWFFLGGRVFVSTSSSWSMKNLHLLHEARILLQLVGLRFALTLSSRVIHNSRTVSFTTCGLSMFYLDSSSRVIHNSRTSWDSLNFFLFLPFSSWVLLYNLQYLYFRTSSGIVLIINVSIFSSRFGNTRVGNCFWCKISENFMQRILFITKQDIFIFSSDVPPPKILHMPLVQEIKNSSDSAYQWWWWRLKQVDNGNPKNYIKI